MKVKIKDKEIELKYSIRALIMYENIAEKTFTSASLTDTLMYFYCVIMSSSKDYAITWEEFLDWIDENSNVLQEFVEWLQTISKNQNKLKKE